jgi:hypothetical protein
MPVGYGRRSSMKNTRITLPFIVIPGLATIENP